MNNLIYETVKLNMYEQSYDSAFFNVCLDDIFLFKTKTLKPQIGIRTTLHLTVKQAKTTRSGEVGKVSINSMSVV